MEKRELVRDMERVVGSSFITKKELTDYLGLSHPRYVTKYVDGLQKLNGRKYFVPEVCQRIKEDLI